MKREKNNCAAALKKPKQTQRKHFVQKKNKQANNKIVDTKNRASE
jgi:hypothetical protein